ncbi:rho GTPase-activating protein 21-B-like isoform X1 [Phycodurus eques]|uniref:rho GTPase-activating protein 21-B-like isoform X1 n=2 Tax=Phycodurus eques TaxID=693459 RepID=UPI002ACDC118|nr:rho GTPase-activating protein 21-B-like isoform X1 [Phycodurus eques]
MLAQRNGLPSGCKPVPLRDLADLRDADPEGCCSLSASASSGTCPWARLAGADCCLSEPYCLWFQLLARAYWGELELGLKSSSRGVSWARLREASRKNCVRSRAKRKDGPEQSDASAAASPGPEEEPFSWPGPKTLRLRRTSQGFGFTLRHFIVYPPESAVHNSLKDEESGSRGRRRSRLEPMDTIFVKQVKDGGPAHRAGLSTGDRIVKVNGESIIGKTYSQVIALIQNSGASLELCVMPKDEDILQLFSRDITALAYSQDAYLKGNAAYSGNARNIPEPPPICYPRIEVETTEASEPPAVNSAPREAAQGGAAEKSYRVEIPVPPSGPASVCGDDLRTAATTPERSARAGPGHRTEDDRCCPSAETPSPGPAPLVSALPAGAQPPHPSSVPAAPATLSPPPSARPSLSRPGDSPVRASPAASPDAFSPKAERHPPSPAAPSSSSPHQNIDWRNYTTYKDYIDAKRLHTYGCRTIQERLDSLRAAADSSSAYSQQRASPPCGSQRGPAASQVRWRSISTDRGANGGPRASPLRSASQDRLGGSERKGDWPRSASQDALLFSGPGAGEPRARSFDYLGQRPAEERGLGAADRAGLEERLLLCQGEEARASRQGASQRTFPHLNRGLAAQGASNSSLADRTCGKPPLRPDGNVTRPSRLPVQNSIADPSAGAKTPDLQKERRTRIAANHVGYLELRTRADSLKMDSRSEASLAARSSSCSGPSYKIPTQSGGVTCGAGSQKPKASVRTNGGPAQAVEGLDATAVVLRKDKNSGAARARPPSYVFAVCDNRGAVSQKSPPLVKAGSADAVACWTDSRREPHLRRPGGARQRRGSRDPGDSLDSIPFIDEPSSPSLDVDTINIPASAVISTTPVMATSPLVRRHMSHDHDSLRLTVIESDSGGKTERSLSCDEGLDNYREDSAGRSLIAGLKGFRKAVDRSSEDSGSRRDSSSDIFCDAAREGLLHFKQLNTDKGKRVGGGMRPWKQMYAVLRGHHLCLYKDKKDGRADEPPPISVRACLVDISYSDTKRKNVLRLTTSDREYLFQAEDRDDMLAWIRVIQQSGDPDEQTAAFTSHDLISRKIREYNTLMSPTGSRTEPSPRSSRQSLSIRQSLLGGKGDAKTPSPHSPKPEQEKKNTHKDDASPPKDKGPWRKGIPGLMRKPFEKKPSPGVTFGVRLDDCPPAHDNKFVPLIVEVCCKLVEERGLEYTGIYRVPGNNAAISNMQDELNSKGLHDIDIQDDKWRDLNVISSLLKSFFRKLPEPLFTNERYADFIEANRIENPVERLKVLKRLLRELPDHHFETLKFLSAHLKTVADNSEKNKMEPRNLAIVFGPTLVRTTEDNMTHMVTHMPDQYKIVETLIQNYDWFFTEDGNGDPVTASHEESAVESQPVPNIDHLLTNIGRTGTPQGEVSDSPTSDSAKSKGSWGSGKDQCGRDLLVSSIFAAASRKRKKSKEKVQPSSSDDDLDAVFPRKEIPGQKADPQRDTRSGVEAKAGGERTQNGRCAEMTLKAKRDARRPSTDIGRQALPREKASSSDPPSSDLGTLSSGASVKPTPSTAGASADLRAGPAGVAEVDVSSITSDYSTTSSVTFPTGAESLALTPELQGGEEADDERSELVSEGRPAETDSESDFPVFAPGGGRSTPCPEKEKGGGRTKMEGRRLFPTQKMMECDTISRRRSLRHKTDSESSAEVAGGEGRADASTRLARVLEGMKKGRSTSSLSSSSRSESERSEPAAWHLKITERLKFRLRTSSDDMFAPKTRAGDGRRRNNIRRRHTMGGQRDFAELAAIHDWREQGGADQTAELSLPDRLKPRRASQDFNIRDWLGRECVPVRGDSGAGGPGRGDPGGGGRGSPPPANTEAAPKAVPEDTDAQDAATANGKSKSPLGDDAHPHKLSGAQVVRSRFYQYL